MELGVKGLGSAGCTALGTSSSTGLLANADERLQGWIARHELALESLKDQQTETLKLLEQRLDEILKVMMRHQEQLLEQSCLQYGRRTYGKERPSVLRRRRETYAGPLGRSTSSNSNMVARALTDKVPAVPTETHTLNTTELRRDEQIEELAPEAWPASETVRPATPSDRPQLLPTEGRAGMTAMKKRHCDAWVAPEGEPDRPESGEQDTSSSVVQWESEVADSDHKAPGTYASYLERSRSRVWQTKGRMTTRNLVDNVIDSTTQAQHHTYSEEGFDAFFGIILLSNILVMGVQIDYAAAHPEESTSIWITVVDCIYCALFVVEILGRINFGGPAIFVRKEDRHWNLFDVLVVIITIIDLVVSFAAGSSNSNIRQNIAMARLLRICRVVRVVRVCRMLRFFRRLRILIAAIGGTLKSCASAILLLCMVIYTFAVTFTQAVTSKVQGTDELKLDNPDVHTYFGSLPRSFYTLFMSIMGGIDWYIASGALGDVHWFLFVLFIVYITFVVLIVMNSMTSIFVQCAIESAESDRADAMAAVANDSDKHIQLLERLFMEWDTSHDGYITMEEFEMHIHDEEMRTFLKTLNIEIADPTEFFKLLDADCGGSLDVREFVEGCLQLRGTARSVQVGQLMRENHMIMDKLVMLEGMLQRVVGTACAEHMIRQPASITVNEVCGSLSNLGGPTSLRQSASPSKDHAKVHPIAT